MRKSERRFLNKVTNELNPLETIAKELGWDYVQAREFAIYLSNEKLIRLCEMVVDNGGIIYVVAKPIKNESWIKREYKWIVTTLIAVIIAIVGWLLNKE